MPLAPGGVLMAFVFRARDRLSSGSVGPITRRSATALALGAALAAAVLALAAGIAIGKYWSARGVSGMQSANRIERDYAIDQLGKLNASVAQIEPRIARLTAQVGALRDFETRLNTPRPAPLAPVASPAASPGASPTLPASSGDSSATDSEGEGGPSLPPRRCVDAPRYLGARLDAERTGEQLDCIAATLGALEQQTAARGRVRRVPRPHARRRRAFRFAVRQPHRSLAHIG